MTQIDHAKENKNIRMAATCMISLVLAYLDYVTGAEMGFSVMYLIPVLWAATIHQSFGIAISLLCAVLSLSSDYMTGLHDAKPVYYIWDFGSHAAIFTLTSVMRSRLIRAREREHELAMTDPLTGALNSRAFYEAAQTEIERARRYKHTLSIAYLDVDDFKIINDTSGHRAGDNLLKVMVEVMKSRVRRMDIVARLGGDEFAILMPETDQTAAMSVVGQTLKSLADETRKNNWPVTFSTGVLTIPEAFSTVNKMIEVADALMYEAKHGGKNRVRQATYGEYP